MLAVSSLFLCSLILVVGAVVLCLTGGEALA